MPYCTIESVRRQLPLVVINDDTKVAEADVAAWCADVEAEIDSERALISDTGNIDDSDEIGAAHLKWIQMLATKSVAARVLGGYQGDDQVNEQANRLALDFRMGLQRFLKARGSRRTGGGGPEFGSAEPYAPVVTRVGNSW